MFAPRQNGKQDHQIVVQMASHRQLLQSGKRPRDHVEFLTGPICGHVEGDEFGEAGRVQCGASERIKPWAEMSSIRAWIRHGPDVGKEALQEPVVSGSKAQVLYGVESLILTIFQETSVQWL